MFLELVKVLRKVLEKTCLDGPILRELCYFSQYQKAFLLFWLFIRQKKGEHVQDSLENETVKINEKIKKSKKIVYEQEIFIWLLTNAVYVNRIRKFFSVYFELITFEKTSKPSNRTLILNLKNIQNGFNRENH